MVVPEGENGGLTAAFAAAIKRRFGVAPRSSRHAGVTHELETPKAVRDGAGALIHSGVTTLANGNLSAVEVLAAPGS